MKCDVVIFDLDDTLFYEIDFLKSAYEEISQLLDKKESSHLYIKMLNLYDTGYNVFDYLEQRYELYSKEDLVNIYRNHIPKIFLNEGVCDVLNELRRKGCVLGVITDGRSITQRNKLKSLGIIDYFNEIIISEESGKTKNSSDNFDYFETKYKAETKCYIGDNLTKDFLVPNKLNWTTICLLDKGCNIHKQDFTMSERYLPKHTINKIIEVLDII